MTDRPKPRVGSHWKRPPSKVYDYNYDISQQYYKPLMRHLDKKSAGVESELPGPKTYAERLAEDPLCGRSKPVNYTTSDYASPSGRSAGLDDNTKRGPDARDGSGAKSTASLLDDAFDDLKNKHRSKFDIDSFLDDEDNYAAGKRREVLRNLKSDLMDDFDSGSRLASSSSVNIRQRSVKSTITSESVRA